MNKINWIDTGNGNIVLKAKWGRISYNPDTTSGHLSGGFTALGNFMGQLLEQEELKDGEETALYVEKIENWKILTGDFRKEYEKVFPNLKKCLKVYEKNIEHKNNWSTD